MGVFLKLFQPLFLYTSLSSKKKPQNHLGKGRKKRRRRRERERERKKEREEERERKRTSIMGFLKTFSTFVFIYFFVE